MKDKTVVGRLHCPGCPMEVYLVNDEGVEGSPENDRLQSHNYHGSTNKCRSCTSGFESRRQQGKFFQEELLRPTPCNHEPIVNNHCLCGATLKLA